MTTSIAQRVGQFNPTLRPRSPFGALADVAMMVADAESRISWPSVRYRDDPVSFFEEILGVLPWDRQIEVIEAVRDYARVSIAAGHKVSKSHTAAGIALWFYCSFDDARVVMSSTTSRQVDEILWRELRMMVARAGRCAECKKDDVHTGQMGPRPCEHSALIDGRLMALARSGLKSEFRSISGFTAKEAEAVAGISGKNLLYIVDEASGVPDVIFEAIEGNRAGGARIVLFSNPTQNSGEFAASHHEKALQYNNDGSPRVGDNGKQVGFYKAITIPSTDSPNVRAGREVIPGLALSEWIEEKKLEWGEDSPQYKVRVLGQFVKGEDGKILSVHSIFEAETRYAETSALGRLHVGIDPAGPGGQGDETVFALRRGQKAIKLVAKRGLSDAGHISELHAILAEHRNHQKREVPLVKVDREGPIGNAVFGLLRAQAALNPRDFEVLGVRSSDKAVRQPMIYDRVRDELWANLHQWIKGGGAIPEDAKLSKELNVPKWIHLVNGRLKVTPKDEFRKELGRSPDRADALALAVWEPDSNYQLTRRLEESASDDQPLREVADPYAVYGSSEEDSVYGGRRRRS